MALPDELSALLDAPCDPKTSPPIDAAGATIGKKSTVTSCGRDGRVSMVLWGDSERVLGESFAGDPLPQVPPPVRYPRHVLARVVCDDRRLIDPDGQTVLVDGRNLWIRTARRDSLQYPVGSLLIADRARLSESDARFIREILLLDANVDLDDDDALKAALAPTSATASKRCAAFSP